MYNYVTDSVKLHNTLMVLMEISLILELWIMREEKLKKMVSIGVLFFSSFCVMCVFLNDHRYQIGDNDHPSCMIDVPVWTLFAGMFLLLISLCLLIRKEIIVCRKSISFWSVKETIDNVPCGACVSDPLGRLVLSNKKMRELGRKLTGEL